MTRDISALLRDMLESIHKIEGYASGFDEKSFAADTHTQDAVIRRLEMNGEAAKNLPERIKKSHPDIRWKEIAGMRDVLIHAYFGVDSKRVWKVVETDLPKPRSALVETIAAETAPEQKAEER